MFGTVGESLRIAKSFQHIISFRVLRWHGILLKLLRSFGSHIVMKQHLHFEVQGFLTGSIGLEGAESVGKIC